VTATLAPAPHVVAANSVRRMMLLVLAALLPVVIAHVVFFGIGLIVQIVIGTATALAAEALALRLRGKALMPFLTDGSVLITGTLLALCLPPLAPWWLIASGVAFAVLLAKHVYGGLGANPFNPAMVGYAVLLVSFPAQLLHWLPAAFGDANAIELSSAETVQTILSGDLPSRLAWDAVTSPTPLNALRTGLALGHTMQETQVGAAFGALAGRGWEWINSAALLGGIALLALKVIRWQIPVAMLAVLIVASTIAYGVDPGTYAGPLFHLGSGATMLGAFFIATDPVSAATSDRGRLIYGALIGIVTWIIRTWGGYPDGVAFAVLLANLAVPLIDRYTVPRIYGHARS
jgi:electron transport complex protein RnfD